MATRLLNVTIGNVRPSLNPLVCATNPLLVRKTDIATPNTASAPLPVASPTIMPPLVAQPDSPKKIPADIAVDVSTWSCCCL
eukprot:CAMPEP_0172028058 /NCGR_PEP_ID=MMETSP1041-20130122/17348_1 /TAXON_ID=464988 /ORGANISM="Hemiselmis andersenii, Strain CCMP439" /LENGTH=81 /DNA_ID=CAMNT_0012684035 /DNA_START=111 /DNA_END=356 /DNA_ORIENTATION=+